MIPHNKVVAPLKRKNQQMVGGFKRKTISEVSESADIRGAGDGDVHAAGVREYPGSSRRGGPWQHITGSPGHCGAGERLPAPGLAAWRIPQHPRPMVLLNQGQRLDCRQADRPNP